MTTHDANATMNETPAEPTFDPSLPKADAPAEHRSFADLGGLLDFVARRDVDHQFTYHAPSPEQLVRYDAIRQMGRVMAHTIIANAPHSPDRSTALRKLREAVMTANAAIALEHGPAFDGSPTPFPDAPDSQPTG